MQLSGTPWHLAYCTNIHPAESWAETLAALKRHTLRVRDRISESRPFAIGLRLSDLASRELLERRALSEFRGWMDRENCYVFTINGFPFGQFHGARVKEQVYRPDWTADARAEYTLRLFKILAELLPPGAEGSVSTLPGSFKEFGIGANEEKAIYRNIWHCAREISTISESTGKTLHLGFEPEPLGWFENVAETVAFFERLREHPEARPELWPLLGVNYDTCHLALEYEDPHAALDEFRKNNIRVSKFHLSSALQTRLSETAIELLRAFDEPTYLHQVLVRKPQGVIQRFRDLPDALDNLRADPETEARVHFHVPLHWRPEGELGTTMEHTEKVLQELKRAPGLCTHLEIETYTWGVLPPSLRSDDVVDQLQKEYETVLSILR